jgi:hypothetical protein
MLKMHVAAALPSAVRMRRIIKLTKCSGFYLVRKLFIAPFFFYKTLKVKM